MKIYENANDQHVRKVVLYGVGNAVAFDPEGTELLTKEQIVDAFLKGCVVENEGNYKTPTGVNVTDSGAELVFGEGGSGGPEVENAIETGGLGWTESEPKEGFNITWDGNTEGLVSVSDAFFKVSNLDIANLDVVGSVITANLNGVSEDTEITQEIYEAAEDDFITDDYCNMQSVIIIHNDNVRISENVFTEKGVYFMKMGEMYTSRLYKEASTEEVVHQIDEKYIPSGGSGGGTMVAHITVSQNEDEEAEELWLVTSVDKTAKELGEASFAGMNVYVLIYATDIDMNYCIPLSLAINIPDANTYALDFGAGSVSVQGGVEAEGSEDRWAITLP